MFARPDRAAQNQDVCAGELDKQMKQGTKRGRGAEYALQASQPVKKRAARRRGTRSATTKADAATTQQAMGAAGLEDDDVDM